MALADALQRHLGGNASRPPTCDASVGECLQDLETESPERHGDMIAITAEPSLQRSLEGRPDLLATEMRSRVSVAPLPRHSLILTRPIPVLQSAPI